MHTVIQRAHNNANNVLYQTACCSFHSFYLVRLTFQVSFSVHRWPLSGIKSMVTAQARCYPIPPYPILRRAFKTLAEDAPAPWEPSCSFMEPAEAFRRPSIDLPLPSPSPINKNTFSVIYAAAARDRSLEVITFNNA